MSLNRNKSTAEIVFLKSRDVSGGCMRKPWGTLSEFEITKGERNNVREKSIEERELGKQM